MYLFSLNHTFPLTQVHCHYQCSHSKELYISLLTDCPLRPWLTGLTVWLWHIMTLTYWPHVCLCTLWLDLPAPPCRREEPHCTGALIAGAPWRSTAGIWRQSHTLRRTIPWARSLKTVKTQNKTDGGNLWTLKLRDPNVTISVQNKPESSTVKPNTTQYCQKSRNSFSRRDLGSVMTGSLRINCIKQQ